jgi:nucleoside-diphosphate-sugar epimerase
MKFLIFGGGGKVSKLFTLQAIQQGHQTISIVRNEDQYISPHFHPPSKLIPYSFPELKSLGTQPIVLSLESSTVPDLVTLLSDHKPDTIIWSAGAGGKGGKERTMAVDYEGAVKVFEAMEISNFRRLVYVGAVDVRSREKGVPEYYNEESGEFLSMNSMKGLKGV